MGSGRAKKRADEIYRQCVKEKMSCREFDLLVTFLKLHKEAAFSTVRDQVDELPLPSRD